MTQHCEKMEPSEEEILIILINLLSTYNLKDQEDARSFLEKHCYDNKKTLYETLMDFSDPGKFYISFKKWQQGK